ncbi:MAG: alpha/beta hydrolase [Bacteriovoracaceae bacterium]|jgi:pimeloyl-ACP methyl ester carboxylesterase|nr:alpha/beta hydrolase [Bacteriovoracaceae bacterium]
MNRYQNYPDTPTRPHNYFKLEGKKIHISHPEVSSGIDIHYVEKGEGSPLVLIHGLMTSSYSFRYIIDELSKTYRVIVPDLPGAGRSAAPRQLSMSAESMGEAILGIIQALKLEKPYIVGNSLGGYQAAWFAINHPESLGKLMILHSPGIPEPKLYLLENALKIPGTESIFRLLVKKPEFFVVNAQHYKDDLTMSKEEAREYGSIFHDRDRTHLFYKLLKYSMSPTKMKTYQERLAEMFKAGSWKVPVHLLWATKDVMVDPASGPKYQKLFPGAKLNWVEDSSHFLQVDAPNRTIREIISFDTESS